MAKYVSGRQQNLKIGITSYSENLTSLEVIGNVGIGTTNATSKLYVVGDGYFTGILTANRIVSTQYGEFTGGSISGSNIVGTSLSISGISTLGITSITNLIAQQLNVSGITTLGIVTSGNIFSTGIITASSFVRVGGSSTQFLKADGSIDSNVYNTAETDTLDSVTGRGNTTSNGISVGILTATSGNFSGIITSSGANISGVTTLGIVTSGNIFSTGIITADSFRPSSGYIQSPNGTNSFYIYDGTGNVAFQGTIGASQINNASGYKVIGFAGTNVTFENNALIAGVTTSTGGFVGNLTGIATTALNLSDAANITTGTINSARLSGTYNIDISGNAATATYATTSGIATYATSSGIATYATNAGVTTALQYSRDFSITGNFVTATAISFDGTGNVALAATITPDSIGLGTYTYGDYVKNISGTTNEITVTSGTGEGSTPTLSIPIQFTAPQDVTVTRDLQVNRNLNVNGNITLGGTTAFINVQELKVYDADLVLGVRTDGNGNDISTDNTANHGGIAVASTEGNPLVSLYNPGIGESTLPTYKKFMWFKAGAFAGLNTDAWLSNYAIGIGSTQFPSGTRLAAGSVQFSENDLRVIRNINASGIITGTLANNLTLNTSGVGLSGIATYNNSGTTTFTVTSNASSSNTQSTIVSRDASGNFSAGTITANLTGTASTASFATTAYNLTDAANITTGTINSARLSGTYNIDINGNASSATYATSSGIATYATNAGTSTSVIGGIGSITQLFVSGISTVGNFLITPIGIGATVGGIGITYYGDGSKLQGLVSGINVQDEGTTVGTSVTTLNFTGVSVSISTAIGGISTVSISSNYADNAGISTNLKGGLVGNIVYQSGVDATTFLTNGNSGYILQSNGVGAAPSWVAAAPSNAISGLTVQDENSTVGTANAVTSINFVGSNIIATASGAGATITVSNNLVGTALSISGISTLGIITAGNIFSTGIITASSFVKSGGTSSQFLKADGSVDANTYLTAESDTLNSVTNRGNTTSNGISVGILTATNGNFSGIITSSGANISGITTITTELDVGIGGTIFTALPNGNIGIGTTNPTTPLYVVGDGYFTGILTANRIVSTQYGEFTGGGISGTNIVGTSLSISGISTFSNGPVLIGSATSTGTANQKLQIVGGAYVSDNLGIGTTNPTSPLYVVGDGYFTGNLSGNGSNLSGIVTSVVAGSNVNVSSSTGQVTISVTTLDMLEVMLFA